MKNKIHSNIFFFVLGIAITILIFGLMGILPEQNEFNQLSGDVVITPLTPGYINSTENTIELRDKASPQDFFREQEIKVYSDRVLLNVENVQWAAFEDTKSMLPVINKDSNALQITPKCPEEIQVGDIISYNSEYSKNIIIHRVAFIGSDNQGPYFILKGDNNLASDPGKIRCEQIQRKVIAILY